MRSKFDRNKGIQDLLLHMPLSQDELYLIYCHAYAEALSDCRSRVTIRSNGEPGLPLSELNDIMERALFQLSTKGD